MSYYLWQRGKTGAFKETHTTILKSIDLDYMGAAEFECGALPGALSNFLKDKDNTVFGSVKIPLEGKTQLIHYWVRESQVETLKQALIDLAEGKLDLMESCNLFKPAIGGKGRVVFGIDQGFEFFAWTSSKFKAHLEKVTPNSVKMLKLNGWLVK